MSVAEQTPQSIAHIFAEMIQPVKRLGRHLPHGFEAGHDGHGIRIEGSTMMYFERSGVIENRHHARGPSHAAHRKSAADNFSEGRQIRRDAMGMTSAMIIETEVQDLIGDQNNSVTRGFFTQKTQESRTRRN